MLYRGVYRLTGAPVTWHQRIFAASQALGPGTFASHLAAAALWDLPRFGEAPPEFIVPRSRSSAPSNIIMHRVGPLAASDTAVRCSIPVTGAVRTVFDLAGIASVDLVEGAFEDVLRRRLATLTRFRWQLSQPYSSYRRGINVMRKLLSERAPGSAATESPLETDVLQLFRRAGIKGVVPQYAVFDRGSFVARVDFAIRDARIAFEAQSFKHHSGLKDWARDHTRGNRLIAAGWLLFPITQLDLNERQEELIQEIKDAIRSRLQTFG